MERPPGLALAKQRWLSLSFLHWPLPPAEVQRLLPPGLEVETFDGQAWVGLVPFTMRGVRLALTLPVPGLSAFHETNVRTYVRRGGASGVWFFSLDAASRFSVWAGRTFFHLNYQHAQMELRETGPVVEYRSRRSTGEACQVRCERDESSIWIATPGTLEHFLIERYWLFAAHRERMFRARVHHAPYRVQRARALEVEEGLIAAAGMQRPSVAPLTHFSPGVSVEIFAPEPA
jgi:uncharacterized protein YqjF (DUF2071 family)